MTSMKTVHRQIFAVGVFVGSLAALAFGTNMSQTDQLPFKVPYEEVSSHRIGRLPVLRAQLLDTTLTSVLAVGG